MRALAGVAAMILVIGVIGVVITFLMYILMVLLAIGVGSLLIFGLVMLNERRIANRYARRDATVAESEAARVAAEEFEQSLRHPAWEAAITKRRDQRQRLVTQYVDLDHRIARLKAQPNGLLWPSEAERVLQLEQEMAGVRGLMRQTFGQVPSWLQATQLDVEPPRDEVIHLDREFMQTGDCRYGHWDEHAIDDFGGGRILRRCTYCEPNTRWTERV